MKIKLTDGSVIEAQKGATALEIAAQISEGLARAALAAKADGVLVGLDYRIEEDCALQIVTFKDEEGRDVYRHTAAHIMAQAVKNVFPTAKLAIGPAVKNGFYYDFDFEEPITLADFDKIEKEMQSIIKADFPIVRTEVTRKQALTQMKGFDEPYKIQLIDELPKDEKITLYTQGGFTDLCRGPHLPSTGRVKNFKLTQLAGAYWRGNEKNKMLTRIYGTAFEKKSDLNEYIERMEEAKKRDHNKLGRDLGIFMTSDVVGQGLPIGAKILQILQRFVEDEEEKRGFMITKTPNMAKSDLYKISGHWYHYRDKMFVLGEVDEHGEAVKKDD